LLLFCTQAGWQAIKEFTLILRRNKTKHWSRNLTCIDPWCTFCPSECPI
jgi:hypothetical protein